MGWANAAIQCFADKFAVNQSLVLRINIFGQYRHLSPSPISISFIRIAIGVPNVQVFCNRARD